MTRMLVIKRKADWRENVAVRLALEERGQRKTSIGELESSN